MTNQIQPKTSSVSDFFGDVIYSYSRADAIKDGHLIDLSRPAKVMGFKIPVAITCGALSASYVDKQDLHAMAQAASTILRTLLSAIAAQKGQNDRVTFALRVGSEIEQYHAVVGPGDTSDPVITIMLPGED